MFMTGAGVKKGFSYGATDELGMAAVDGRMHINDLHATLLALMGIDHERLTYRYAGRNFRLTNVAGVVHRRSIPALASPQLLWVYRSSKELRGTSVAVCNLQCAKAHAI